MYSLYTFTPLMYPKVSKNVLAFLQKVTKTFRGGTKIRSEGEDSHLDLPLWEHSGSVVECLTRDRGAAGSSLTRVTVLCP